MLRAKIGDWCGTRSKDPTPQPVNAGLRWNSPGTLVLAAILLIALALRVSIAIAFPNAAVLDETFQTREPAHYLAYGYGVLSWEWRQGVRSWVFPAFLAGVMRATDWMGAGSSGYLLGVVITLSLVSLTAVWFSFMWAYRTSGIAAAIITSGASAIWYELIYWAPKSLTEVVASHVLLPGLYLGAFGESIPERRRLFVSGLFFGLALSLRLALAPAILFSAVALSLHNPRVRIPAIAAGIFVPVVVFGVVDAATWSYPFQSFVRYFWVNIAQGKSAEFGVRPWFWYLPVLALRLGPMALLAVVGARRSPFLGWVALIILLSHSVVPHKEFRFIYPIVPLVITLGGLGVADILLGIRSRVRLLASVTAVCTVGLVLVGGSSGVLARFFPLWSRFSGPLVIIGELSRDATVCGVAVTSEYSGGYSYLHRHVPIYPTLSQADIKRLASSFNVIVTFSSLNYDGFNLAKCRDGTCLYQRGGPCIPSPRDEINEFFRRNGI